MLIWRLLARDLAAKALWSYQKVRLLSLLGTLFTDGTAAMIWYRLMQWARRWHLAPLEMMFNKANAVFCNCIIGRGAEFGPGFVLIHSTGTVINGQVRGGSNIYVEHQVTIGAKGRRSPVIGNDVFIGAGAKIIGPVTVGNGARIGANAVVVNDVPDHSTVIGIPARVVRVRSSPPLTDDTMVGRNADVLPASTASNLAAQCANAPASEHSRDNAQT